MNLTTLILSVSLSATPAVTSERPVWAGAIQPGGDVVVVAAVTGGLGVRTATASTLVAGDAAAPLGAVRHRRADIACHRGRLHADLTAGHQPHIAAD